MHPRSRTRTLRGAVISALAGALLMACTAAPSTPAANTPASSAQATPTTAAATKSTSPQASPSAAATKPAAQASPSPAATKPAGGATPIAAATKPAGTPAANTLPELKVDSADFSFNLPDSIPAGWVKVTLSNSGKEPHHAQIARLNDGVTLQDFEAAMKQGEQALMQKITLEGGPAAIAPGGHAEVILNLRPGQYALLCFLPSPDGTPHLAKGMIKPFNVAEASGKTSEPPTTQGTITLRDFSFEMPDTISAGMTNLKVVNEGEQPHEIAILQLAEGKTGEDAIAFMSKPSGQPPFVPVGGMQGLNPKGGSGILSLDLKPGKYFAICQIPDPKSQKSHLELGMGKEFTVK